MNLTKITILSAPDSAPTPIDVPEWGGTVCVRVMTGTERNQWESQLDAHRSNFRASLLVRCLCDESGARMFEDSDAEALGAKSGVVLDRLFDVAFKANGLGQYGVDQAKKN